MANGYNTNPTSRGSIPWDTIKIEEIDTVANQVIGINGWGKPISVPLSVQRAKGALPQPGETWIIDRALGNWNLAAVQQWIPPTVTGNQNGENAVNNLAQALGQQGLIIDNIDTTTPVVKGNANGINAIDSLSTALGNLGIIINDVNQTIPIVNGSCKEPAAVGDPITALVSLVQALAALGIIIDQTDY